MAETQEVRDKVVLVGLNSPVLKKKRKTPTRTLWRSSPPWWRPPEARPWGLSAEPAVPGPPDLHREGKVAEVQLYCENTGATMVIFDNDLSPPRCGC